MIVLPFLLLVLSGRVFDPQGKVVPGARIEITVGDARIAETRSDRDGIFSFPQITAGEYTITASAPDFAPIHITARAPGDLDLRFETLQPRAESMIVTTESIGPTIDAHTLFTRDDQLFQQLNAGINAGQHEGGGKSIEIRRFGFNLDHGGVNGGLKVLVDDVQQNQGSQAHGQGYLGSLKALSPELIQQVEIIDGPFSPEYGDFSGLGVVHIRQRESLPDEFMARIEGGNFHNGRAFLAYSPDAQKVDSYLAYEGSYIDGPFANPARYRRDNVNANYTRSLDEHQKLGFRFLFGRNDFYSSGQIPLDVVDRFGFIDPTDGGRVRLGTASSYYSRSSANGDTLRIDGFVGRSLFDLYSNFTFFLNDPVHGDAFQQHDSRLQEGLNLHYMHPHRIGRAAASFTSGTNLHDNQINVGLYPREGRTPTGVTTRAHAHVTNTAGYIQETLSYWNGRLIVGGGLRFDEFRYAISDASQFAGRWQGKSNLSFTPSRSVPLTFAINYGRGINSVDARAVVQRPDQTRLATTDFYQLAASSNHGRFGLTADVFLIDHSNEQVYIPDDGSFEFKGPSRAYGYEAKTSIQLTRRVSLTAGLTKIGNSYFRGGDHRVYVGSAPHFVANAAITVAPWRGWSGSLRMRAINHYRLDGNDPSIVASGHTLFDLGLAKRVSRAIDFNLSVDNALNRSYYETQNYFESRVSPFSPSLSRIHGTPGFPLAAIAGVTLHFNRKQ